MSWEAVIDAGEPVDEPAAPPDWRVQALDLLRHPGLSAADPTFLRRVANWRAPGADGLARLREIGERVGSVASGAG